MSHTRSTALKGNDLQGERRGGGERGGEGERGEGRGREGRGGEGEGRGGEGRGMGMRGEGEERGPHGIGCTCLIQHGRGYLGLTEVCRLVGTKFATRIRACAEFQFKIPTKSCACANSRRKFVPTNLQTSVSTQYSLQIHY